MKPTSIELILNSTTFTIQYSPKLKELSDEVMKELFDYHKYVVQSHVENNTFKSFIKYLVDDIIPEINMDNFWDYYQLSKEFGILQNEVESKISQYGDNWYNLTYIKNVDSHDLSYYEDYIAQKLDLYLSKYGQKVMEIPIQRLCNIFSHPKNKITNYNLAYETIIQYFKKTNNTEILILLTTLDASKFSEENLIDSILHCNDYFGFTPEITTKSFAAILNNHLNQINELKNEISSIQKENLNQRIQSISEKINGHNFQLIEENIKELMNKFDEKSRLFDLKIKEISDLNKKIDEMSEKNKKDKIESDQRIDKVRLDFENEKSNINQQLKFNKENVEEKAKSYKKEIEKIYNNIEEVSKKTIILSSQIKNIENKPQNENKKINQVLNQDQIHKIEKDFQKEIENSIEKLKQMIDSKSEKLKNDITLYLNQIINEIKYNNEKLNQTTDLLSNHINQIEMKNKKIMNNYSQLINNDEKLLRVKYEMKNEMLSMVSHFASCSFMTNIGLSTTGILNHLKSKEKNQFDKLFIASTSSCDIYNLIDPNTKDDIGTGNDGNFFIEFELERPIKINGIKVFSSSTRFPKSFDIEVDGIIVKSIKEANELNGKFKEMTIIFDSMFGSKVKFIQTGPNWDRGNNFLNMRRFEILSDDCQYSKGAFSTLIEQSPQNDPHKCPVKITAKNYDFNTFFLIDSKHHICTSNEENSWFQIELTKGWAVINGFRLKRGNLYKLRSFKIIATDDANKPLNSWTTLIEIDEKAEDEHQKLDIYEFPRQSPPVKYVRLIQTGPTWNDKLFLMFFHLDFFGYYF